MLYILAKYPEHQEKCREEVDAIFDQKGTIEWWAVCWWSMDDLHSLIPNFGWLGGALEQD